MELESSLFCQHQLRAQEMAKQGEQVRCVRQREGWSLELATGLLCWGEEVLQERGSGRQGRGWGSPRLVRNTARTRHALLCLLVPSWALRLQFSEMGDAPSMLQVRKPGRGVGVLATT